MTGTGKAMHPDFATLVEQVATVGNMTLRTSHSDICGDLLIWLVLLAIHKNWNRSILEVVPSIYQNTVGNLSVQLWFRYQPSYWLSGSIERTTLKITQIHATYYDYSCPLINTGGITP